MKGTVIRVFPNKGFAFVRGEDQLSRFVHARDFEPPKSFDTLREGQAVEFEPVEGFGRGNGLRGRNVRTQ